MQNTLMKTARRALLAGVVAVAGVVTRFMASELGQKLMGFLNTADETDKK